MNEQASGLRAGAAGTQFSVQIWHHAAHIVGSISHIMKEQSERAQTDMTEFFNARMLMLLLNEWTGWKKGGWK